MAEVFPYRIRHIGRAILLTSPVRAVLAVAAGDALPNESAVYAVLSDEGLAVEDLRDILVLGAATAESGDDAFPGARVRALDAPRDVLAGVSVMETGSGLAVTVLTPDGPRTVRPGNG